ncbi:sensor histidine kinase [Bordetella genomosp. 12]|uniref:histidine kinase n=2 Tax=Bordetella genomosp. 12 TaxID=463035 RepID=A0A261VC16_9BORD|nr:sensor histidine kinase [Bordetella genomosp. 12]
MGLIPRAGRLFWKLVLALFLSMALSMAGTFAYIVLASGPTPPPPRDEWMVGPIPGVPLLAGLIAIFLIGMLFAWYLSRPVRTLSWALHRAAQGKFDTRVAPMMQGMWSDEIVELGQDFDRMAEQLQRAMDSQRLLLHDISHELRSPLTRMQAAIGLMRQSPQTVPAMVARIESESHKLDTLIEALLTLHRLDAGAMPGQYERVDLVELLQAIVEDAEFEAVAAQKSVSATLCESFVSQVKGEFVYRAFENIIRNAVKYSPAGTTVEIAATIDAADQLVVTVADRGPGVSVALQERIFDAFFRVEGSASATGSGLGLAVAHRTITAHGGSVQARSRDGGGLVVTVTLPR